MVCLFSLFFFFFTQACCISYHHLLHCINNTGVHTTGNRRGSANYYFIFFRSQSDFGLVHFECGEASSSTPSMFNDLLFGSQGIIYPLPHRLSCAYKNANRFHHQCTKSLIFSLEIVHFQKEREKIPQLTFTGVVITLVFLLYLYGLFRCMHYEYGRS